MTDQSVLNEAYGYVTRIKFNRPKQGNVVNEDNLGLLYKYLDEAINDDNIRVIVIEGSDGVFSRGMDFKNLLKHENTVIDVSFHEPYLKVVMKIHSSPKPVIAAIDGDVLAGGNGDCTCM